VAADGQPLIGHADPVGDLAGLEEIVVVDARISLSEELIDSLVDVEPLWWRAHGYGLSSLQDYEIGSSDLSVFVCEEPASIIALIVKTGPLGADRREVGYAGIYLHGPSGIFAMPDEPFLCADITQTKTLVKNKVICSFTI